MKTFKLISLQVIDGDQFVQINLDDGLIINKEDEKRTWLLEGYVNKSYKDFFLTIAEKREFLTIQAVITKKDNNPATFQTKIISINELEEHLSILFEGSLKRTQNDMAETILKDLLTKGLSGDQLLQEFQASMQITPKK